MRVNNSLSLKRLFFIIVPCLSLIYACSLPAKSAIEKSDISELNGDWSVIELHDENEVMYNKDVEAINRVTISFDLTDNNKPKVSGNDSCNLFSAPIETLNDHEMEIGDVVQSKKLCLDMSVADKMVPLFSNVRHYHLTSGELSLVDNQENMLLKLQRKEGQ